MTILTNRPVHYRAALYKELTIRDHMFFTDSISLKDLPAIKNSLDKTKRVILLRDPSLLINWLVLFYCKVRRYKILVWAGWFTDVKLLNFLRLEMSKLADMNVFYSEHIRVDFVKKGLASNKTSAIPNNKFSVLGRSANERKSIGFIGTLNKRKGIIEFLDLLNSKVEGDSLNVSIVGDGPLLPALRNERFENLNVSYFGELTDTEEISRVLLKCNCIVSPKQIGLSIIDAFANGLPVITLKDAISGGERDSLISNWNSIICDTIEDMVDSTIQYVHNEHYKLRLQRGAYSTYKNLYHWDSYVEQFRI